MLSASHGMPACPSQCLMRAAASIVVYPMSVLEVVA